MKNTRWNHARWIACGLTLAAASIAVSACSSGEPAGKGAAPGTAPTAEQKPKTIRIMTPYFNAEPPKSDLEALKKIQAYTNTKLEVTWIPGSAYNDKLNAAIAGQDLPEVVMARTGSNNNAAFVNALRSGMFWEIGPYLKDYPNLKEMLPDLEANTKIDGKLYGIRKYFPPARDGIIFRKDWLDALGLKEPKTLDELINVMNAFAKKDPDKNGKDDTFAFGSSNGVSGFSLFVSYLGGPNRWEFKDGQMTPMFYAKEYLEAMKLYKQFYNDGLMNKDFPVVTNGFDLINKGKAGMFLGPLDDAATRFGDLAKGFPQAQLDLTGRIEGPKGARVHTMGTLPTLFVFPKTSLKTEAELKQVLSFMDKMSDTEIENLFEWGIEGTHYKVDNGKFVRSDAAKFTADFSDLDMIRYADGSKATKGTLPPIVEKFKKVQNDNLAIAVPNPVQSLISNTFIEKGSQLDKIISDARTKFIIGELDEAGWNKAVDQWKSGGGTQIIKEYTEEYLKYNKK
jgi:putative aldouronate transport system substrate-binding protein